MGEKRGMKGLETWCKRVTNGYPGVKVDNMTTSWRDGLAFCALIHHFRPDLIDFESLVKDDVYGNNELAFRVAEQYLGIPALLDAEDMVEYPVPDRLSILTYLSQFYRAFVSSHQGSSSARTVSKRSAALSERGIVSPIGETPQVKKSPHALSAARREPCARCGLPVFIAERLIVGGRTLYHRSCFRCARCQHQLSLANCYETEDGQYCCETCPDEVGGSERLDRETVDSPRFAGDDTFGASSDNDEYSSTFESAMEGSVPDTKQLSTSSLARSNFMNSQLLFSEPDANSVEESCTLVVDEPGTTEAVRGGDERDVNLRKDEQQNDAMIGMLAPTCQDTDVSATSLTSSVSVDKSTSGGELSPPTTRTKESVSSSSSLSIVQMRLKMFEKSNAQNPEKDGAKEVTTSSNRQSHKAVKNIVVEPVSVGDDMLGNDSHVEVLTVDHDQPDENILQSRQEEVGDSLRRAKSVPATEKQKNDVEGYRTSEFSARTTGAKEQSKMKELSCTQDNASEKHAQQIITLDCVKSSNVENREQLKTEVVSPKKVAGAGQSSYPVDLNPFGDDDDDDDSGDLEGGSAARPVTEAVNISVELGGKPPLPATRTVLEAPKQCLNPFWSDGEEPDSDQEPEHKKTPVPCPRRSKTTSAEMQQEPSPMPRSIGVKVGSITSLSSIGSSAGSTPFGTAQRKKKLAPPPPSARELFPKSTESSRTSSPTPSSAQSPQVIRRHRKSRQAPPPPPPTSDVPEWNHVKDDKNAVNRIRQNGVENMEVARPVVAPNKSVAGQWKRKKGPAPPRPVPQRRQIRAMPMKEVRQELDDIEVQQLGLERQGVKLEQTIRALLEQDTDVTADPDVEDLVLQLFELVNEKNELFRRQAELMYLRRQQRLEEEHADLEYQIRCLLERPDHAKTDSDKAREEELIQRLVEVVERRNEIVECLEMDRRREAEEDRSIHHQLGIFAAKMKVAEEVVLVPSNDKENGCGEKAKEDKKKHKKVKEKHVKKKVHEKVDADKDIDEVEQSLTKQIKEKKGKKRWFH